MSFGLRPDTMEGRRLLAPGPHNGYILKYKQKGPQDFSPFPEGVPVRRMANKGQPRMFGIGWPCAPGQQAVYLQSFDANGAIPSPLKDGQRVSTAHQRIFPSKAGARCHSVCSDTPIMAIVRPDAPPGNPPAGREAAGGRTAFHPGETELIRSTVAASLARPIGLAPVCNELGISRSARYAQKAAVGQSGRPTKRSPKPLVADRELLSAIRSVLTNPPFLGEGNRKVDAGIRTDRERIRNLMRQHSLQAPGKPRRGLGPRGSRRHHHDPNPGPDWGGRRHQRPAPERPAGLDLYGLRSLHL